MDVVIDTSALIPVPEVPEQIPTSPLDVPSIRTDISTQEIVAIVREGRERNK